MSNSQQLAFNSIRAIYILLLSAAVFGILFFGREVLIPIMLSVLIAVVVSPLVFRLERAGLPRLWAVLSTSIIVFVVLGLLGWTSAQQLWGLVEKVPTYKQNLLDRVASFRPSKDNSLSQAIETIGQLEQAMEVPTHEVQSTSNDAGDLNQPKAARPPSPRSPRSEVTGETNRKTPSQQLGGVDSRVPVDVRIVATASSALEQLGAWINPILGPLGTAGLVIILVIFILLDLEDLHDRMIRLTGDSSLHRSNIAIDDAIARVSSYIQMTFLINALYGVVVAAGLALIGIPNSLLWGVLGAVLRFIPYLGPMLVFALPFGLSLAATTGWAAPVWTIALFVVLELILNNIIEPWLYGRSTGVSSMGIIFASIFWAWIWGPVGLVLATPLTVILVVIGRHFPQLQFMTTLFAEKSAFLPHDELFQRLLMDDLSQAEMVAEKFGTGKTLLEVCDQLYLPTLTLVESHRKTSRLTNTQSESICKAVIQLARTIEASDFLPSSQRPVVRNSKPIVIVPERNTEDRTASEVIQHALANRGYQSEIVNSGMLTGELAERLSATATDIAVLSSLGGGRSPLAMSISRRLTRAGQRPELICGLWDCSAISKADREFLQSNGIQRHVTDVQGLIRELEEIAAVRSASNAA
jgi:predicted PurR-regulated permease PerM/methylmalonyl-CoA mutase cobalamin-binding subunit